MYKIQSQHLQLKQMSRLFEPLKDFALLPRGYEIKKFLHKFLQDDEYDLVEQCYYIHSSLKEAYMMIILCLGGPDIPNQIQKIFGKNQQISAQKLERLRVIVDKLIWRNSSNSTKIFIENSQIYKNYHQQLSKQIYPNLNEKHVQNLYKSTCSSSDYLFGTRIREFIKKDYIERANRRAKQKEEEYVLMGNNYLIIHNKETNYIIIGVFRTQYHYNTQSDAQSQKKASRQSQKKETPRNSFEIKEQLKAPEENNNSCCCCVIF